ncbi:unnamed protein product [Paramecium sonneborni]|uniref:Uncharacterized protein n=1 Tax=Paramecium sonneborni TaxID=65129 RepID=A0A8S1M8B1_9CILI|nr:unnamed protein product [Paramecium sonneborni]
MIKGFYLKFPKNYQVFLMQECSTYHILPQHQLFNQKNEIMNIKSLKTKLNKLLKKAKTL